MSDTINPTGTARVTVDDGKRESVEDPGRVSLDPLDPVTALKGLLAVDPPSKPEDDAK